jgi:nucleoside triphosphate pyrophosphatase
MVRIILASKSKARRKLLRQIGFKVTTVETNVKEDKNINRGLRSLVIGNSLKKAKAAKKLFKKGIVIGADTVVFANNRLIGKPKNIKDAQHTIKLLCKYPHWVYSGLTVIDIESNKTYTAYDKTKVYMVSLTDKQIKDYCRKFLPLDKAGSFDIQGPGALFVERIEGCYYNVVGLPLAKLVKILAQVNIDVFST